MRETERKKEKKKAQFSCAVLSGESWEDCGGEKSFRVELCGGREIGRQRCAVCSRPHCSLEPFRTAQYFSPVCVCVCAGSLGESF